MDTDLNNLLQDESEDAVLARIQEESLRYFNEVELPRRIAEQKEEEKKKGKQSVNTEPQPHCSKKVDCGETKPSVTDVFYKAPGQGADDFHLSAGETYVYPTNYPVREYQQTIIRSALFHNTLVSLPTGLGKTFIAAVVMFNYYRWFPQGKIVFMAPTRPLVAQQIRACHDIMAIPIKETIEMTGAMNPTDRLQQWKTKRVFFLTPQVMANDLRTKACPPSSGMAFKCVVIDEAHRATKEYSYCHVIKELEAAGAIFRVLALSATPGSNIKAVVEVVQNLRISTLELRGEDSPDVVPYTHAKQVEPVSLTLSRNIIEFREQYLLIFERYAKSLRESRLITCNVQNVTKFQLLKASEKMRSRPPNGMTKARMGAMMSDLTVCMTLAHGLELLQAYGLRAFHQYFTGCEYEENRKAAFTRLNGNGDFHTLMEKLQRAVSSPMDQFWSHPKHECLVKILKDHFCQAEKQDSDTKVIIFCQYRVVVSELYELLQTTHPLIKPVMFIGQGAGKDRSGLPQKKQIEVMKGFRQGLSNVLIATCVAEEGLDIGSVDLLVMMECQRSPVRLVQRLGRTGRHRQGRCVVLLTCGREVQKFNEAMATRKSFISMIQNSNVLKSNLIKDEPHMVPPHVMPKMQLVHIKVPERITPAKKRKQADIRKALITKINDSEEKEPEESPFLDPEQLDEVEKELGTREINYESLNFTKAEYLFHRFNGQPMQPDELFSPSFSRRSEYNDWNRELHQTYLVLHSSDTATLCHLLRKSETMLLNTHSDLNTQQINCSSLIPSKKDTKKNKAKNDKVPKKIKIDQEERGVRDIRTCLAQAAEKVRLTQTKPDNEHTDQVENVEETSVEVVEISDTGPGATYKQLKNTCNEELKESNCLFCDKAAGLAFGHSLKNETFRADLSNLDLNKLRNAESLVQNLTKEAINNVNITKLFGSSSNTMNNIKNGLIRLKNMINISKKISSPLISVDDIFCDEKNLSQSPVLDLGPAHSREVQKKEMPNKEETEQDYFDLEDLFNEDNDFVFQSLVKNTKTSTPVKCSSSELNRFTCKTDNEKHSKTPLLQGNCPFQNRVNTNNVQGKLPFKSSEFISPISKLNSGPVKPFFKIPQMKLNLSAVSSPHSINGAPKGSNPPSPGSPVLSGQVARCQDSLLSPVLSSQVSVSHNHNLSPILSGQVTSTPKLDRKVLFQEHPSKAGEIETSESCKPLKSMEKHSDTELAEIDAINLLSASQLFDDSSGEDKKENLEQSSMYTISQMVAKVSALADRDKACEPVVGNSGISANKSESSVHFECSDEDSIFDQINLDHFSCQKGGVLPFKEQPKNTIHLNDKSVTSSNLNHNSLNNTNLNVSKLFEKGFSHSSEVQRNEIEKMNQLKRSFNSTSVLDSNSELPVEECSQRQEESFISSRWLTCMKTPLKTNKSVSFAAEQTYVSTHSDSDSDVFESPLRKSKTKLITGKERARHKNGRGPKQRTKAQFLELEANVSVTGGVVCSSDEENTSGLDELDESFINDMTELPSTSVNQTTVDVDIHAKYLQSVKSPMRMPGFKIPTMTDSIMEIDVYSQAIQEDDDDSYENDSFCCDATQIPVEDEPSELEIAERLLKKKSRRNKKRKRKRHKSDSSNEDGYEDCSEVLKKKHLLSSSSSNEDFTSGLIRTGKRKHLSSSDSSPNTVHSKKTLKKRRRIHLLTSDSDSDKTVL